MKLWCNPKKYNFIAISIGVTLLLLGSLAACLSKPLPEVITTVKLSQHARGVAINPDTGAAYILQVNQVSVLHGGMLSSTQQMTQGAGVRGTIIASPYTQNVYVFDSAHQSIWVIDSQGVLTTMQDQTLHFNSYYQYQGVMVHPLTGYIYALNLWEQGQDGKVMEGSVLVITGTQIIAKTPVGHRPSAISIDPRNGLVYVGHTPSTPADYPDMLTVISGTQIIATSDLGQPPGTGGGIIEIVVNSQTGQIFVAFSERLYSLQDLMATNSIHFDKSILRIAYNPVNNRLYAMLMGNEVLVLNTNLDIVKRIVIPYQYPAEAIGNRAMAIDPVRGYVYVGNTGDGTLAVIQDTKVITTLQVGWYTVDIGVDPNAGTVYAINDMSKDVTVIGFPE